MLLIGATKNPVPSFEWKSKTNWPSSFSNNKNTLNRSNSSPSCCMNWRRRMTSFLLLNHNWSSQKFFMHWRICRKLRHLWLQLRLRRIAFILCRCCSRKSTWCPASSLLTKKITTPHIHTSTKHLKVTDQWTSTPPPASPSNSCFFQKSWTNSQQMLLILWIRVCHWSIRTATSKPWKP